MSREMIATPMPLFENPKVQRAGVIGHNHEPAARMQQTTNCGQKPFRVGDMLDCGNEEDKIVSALGKIEFLYESFMDVKTGAGSHTDGLIARVYAFQNPARLSKVAKQ